MYDTQLEFNAWYAHKALKVTHFEIIYEIAGIKDINHIVC